MKSFKIEIIVKVLILIFLVTFLILGNIKWAGKEYLTLKEFLPRYPINAYPPKTLLYSAITPEYLKETAAFWRKEVGIDGFIITTLPSNWNNKPKELNKYLGVAREANKECRKNGIEANFIKIALGHGRLPDYFDDKSWQDVLYQINFVARFARDAGFKGIALDTESYSKLLWNSAKWPNRKYSKSKLKRKIFQRGQEIMEEIVEVFPDAEVFVFPVGHLYAYTKKRPSKYELWIDFFNGLASVENQKGIVLGCERTYRVYRKNKLLHYYYDEIKGPIIGDNIDNPFFWYSKCSVALGSWPLGKSYGNKKAWYNPIFFNRQFRTMEMACPKYVWIYGHGSAWWQEKDSNKYRLHPEAKLPTVRNIKKYYQVVRKSEEPSLKKYYYTVKHGRLPSLLEVIIGNLGFW